MQDRQGYYERMDKSFTPEEKLFFLDKLPRLLDDYDYIVDFGCANGTMLKYINIALNASTSLERLPILVGIDNDIKSLRNTQANFTHGFIGYKSLEDFNDFLKHIFNSDSKKILLILSSVLHEMEDCDYYPIIDFSCCWNCDIVVRDMCFDYSCNDEEKLRQVYETLPSNEQTKIDVIENRMEEELGHLCENYFTPAMYEYFLKYTYRENYSTEQLERYLCNNCWGLRNTLCSKTRNKKNDYKILYERNYILPYKKEQVFRDFGYELRFPTHYQAIFTKNLNYN